MLVGATGRVVGVDITDEQLAKARRLRNRHGFSNVEFVEAHIEELPFGDGTFDAVISNGVINLSPRKDRVFAEGRARPAPRRQARRRRHRQRQGAQGAHQAQRRPVGGVHRGAIPRTSYLKAIEEQGLELKTIRTNDYRFVSERALGACSAYEVESVSLVAVKPG